MRARSCVAGGLALLPFSSCNGTRAAAGTSPTPTASVDIKRTKLDISYASLSDQDVHKVSSKKILEGAIAAINAEIKKTGGKGEMAMIEFKDVQETTVPDFKKFAEAAAAVKALNPQITAIASRTRDRRPDSATPDCHLYVDKSGRASRRAEQGHGSQPRSEDGHLRSLVGRAGIQGRTFAHS